VAPPCRDSGNRHGLCHSPVPLVSVYVLQTDVPNSTSKNAPGSSSGGKDPNVQGLPYNSCQLEDRGRDGHHVFTDPWGGAARASRPDSLFLQPRPLTGAFGGAATLFAVTYLVRISSIYNCGWRVRRYGPPPPPPAPRARGVFDSLDCLLYALCFLCARATRPGEGGSES
jgi:hypothetical protein